MSISLELPKDAVPEVALVAPAPRAAIGPGATAYEPYVDIYPASYRKAAATVLSSAGRLIAVAPVRLSDVETAEHAAPAAERVAPATERASPATEHAAPAAERAAPATERASLYLATPQHILLYLLQWANRTDGAAREAYRTYYQHTLEVLKAAEELFEDAGSEKVADLFEKSPFAPSVRTLGAVNTDAAYVIKMAGYAARLHDTPPAVLGLEADVAGILTGLPQNYYPGRPGAARPPFDYGGCPLYRRSGLPAGD
jgi:hypothetical protein